MSQKTGSMYRIGGRRYVDSQALANLAERHELVPQSGGWRMLVDYGAVRFGLVEGKPALPRQRGSIYSVSGEGRVTVKEQREAWVRARLVEAVGTYESWPGESGQTVGKSCGKSCACAPCQQRHADGGGEG